MPKECEQYKICNFAVPYRQGLEGPDKAYSQYINSTCLNGGTENCPHNKNKITLDKKLKEK